MRTIEVNLYKFNELSEDAKQTAIEKWRSSGSEYFWTEENKDSLEAFTKIFPVKIREWSYGGQESGASFSMECDDEISELSGPRLMAYLWNNYKGDLFKGKWYGSLETSERVNHKRIKSKKTNAGYYNPYYSAITLDNTCVMTGYCMDDAILGPVYKFLDKPDNTTFEDLMRDCFDEWVNAREADIEYQNSDEYIADHLIANEYEFDEEGNMQ